MIFPSLRWVDHFYLKMYQKGMLLRLSKLSWAWPKRKFQILEVLIFPHIFSMSSASTPSPINRNKNGCGFDDTKEVKLEKNFIRSPTCPAPSLSPPPSVQPRVSLDGSGGWKSDKAETVKSVTGLASFFTTKIEEETDSVIRPRNTASLPTTSGSSSKFNLCSFKYNDIHLIQTL